MSDNCVFCKIVAKQIPASVVYEDGETLAFMDLGQVNPGHVLVAAKGHAENVYALDDVQAAAVFRTAVRVARRITSRRGRTSRRDSAAHSAIRPGKASAAARGSSLRLPRACRAAGSSPAR